MAMTTVHLHQPVVDGKRTLQAPSEQIRLRAHGVEYQEAGQPGMSSAGRVLVFPWPSVIYVEQRPGATLAGGSPAWI
jgi:hypothetical protein